MASMAMDKNIIFLRPYLGIGCGVYFANHESQYFLSRRREGGSKGQNDKSTYRTGILERAPQRGRQRCTRSDPSQPTAEKVAITKMDTSGDGNVIDLDDYLVEVGANNGLADLASSIIADKRELGGDR